MLLDRIKRLFECQSVREQKNTLNLLIFQTRMQFLIYRHPLLNSLTAEDKLLIASLEDIACMKISAIAGRGDKKDFYAYTFFFNGSV